MRDPSTVAEDVRCGQCGYNLRGMPASGLCPECAHPVEVSRRVEPHDGWSGGDIVVGMLLVAVPAALGLANRLAVGPFQAAAEGPEAGRTPTFVVAWVVLAAVGVVATRALVTTGRFLGALRAGSIVLLVCALAGVALNGWMWICAAVTRLG